MGWQKGKCCRGTKGVCTSRQDERYRCAWRLEGRSGEGGLSASRKQALTERLAGFDGKAVTLLTEAEAAFSGDDDYAHWLVDLAGHEDWHISSAATWLLRQYLEADATLGLEQTGILADQLGRLPHWSSQLHVCQSVRHLAPDEAQAERFAAWLETMQRHKRPFVRAWALDGLVALARKFKAFSARGDAALATAGQDDAASVRARARNLRKALPSKSG